MKKDNTPRKWGPKFIPKQQVDPTKEYPGYIARADGLVREDQKRDPGDVYKFEVDYGELDPIRKRTSRQQVDSLTKRVVDTFTTLGCIPDSVMKEIQVHVKLKSGRDYSTEDLQKIAAWYMQRAHAQEETAQRKRVTRNSYGTWSGNKT